MRVTIKKRGNNMSVHIPAAVMRAAGLRLGQSVDVREERGRIIIEPARFLSFDLEALIAAITDENRHPEIAFGMQVGREID